MQIYDFESWFTLLTGFAIFIMGLRVFWLDSTNRMYQAFMLSTFLLFVQNFFFFLMGQTQDLNDVMILRSWQENSWNLASSFICITMWFYAKQFIPRIMRLWEKRWLVIVLLLTPFFILLQAFPDTGHGHLFLNNEQQWLLTLSYPQWYDFFRIMWVFTIYAASIYFSYLPFKYAHDRISRWTRGSVFFVFSIILLGSFLQNYFLTIFFNYATPINESTNVAIGALFSGLMLINLQLNDLTSEHAIPNLLKTMTNWFILTDDTFNIRRVNDAFVENMKKDNVYWQNSPVQSIFEPAKWASCKENILLLKRNQSLSCEFKLRNNGHVFYILFSITPIYKKANFFKPNSNKIVAYTFVGANMSQFKESENKIKAYAKNLETTIQALESFAYIASHDLKEPIRNIGSFSSLLRRRLGDEIKPNIKEYLGFIEQNVLSMNQLIDSVMTVSRVGKDGINTVAVDLNATVNESLKRLMVLHDNKKAIVKIDKLPIIQGDSLLILQLFQNLLENGMKYNNSIQPSIHIYPAPSNNKEELWVKIQDNGIGIEKEYREQVFKMFKRLHSREMNTGSGVGLAICKRIMDLHQGQIWIEEPSDDKGTIFVLSFPKEISS